jgi:predicted DNA-binding protein
MTAEISDRVREIAEARGLPESEVLERALERGLEDLWEDLVLAQYLDGDLDREEAIERVGRTKVERADRDREVAGPNPSTAARSTSTVGSGRQCRR